MLKVPDKFNRNHPAIQAMGSPADTGLRIIEYMCERMGISDLAGRDVLDFGCGCRFADAIVNRNVALQSYVGIDIYKEMIDFLAANVADRRLQFLHIDARNPIYNSNGRPIGNDTVLPIGDREFDVICMYSVITHQLPGDAAAIFGMLRRYIRPNGRLFFSAKIEPSDSGYFEAFPETPTALSVYSMELMSKSLEQAGWRILSFAGLVPDGLPNQDTFLCAPIEPENVQRL